MKVMRSATGTGPFAPGDLAFVPDDGHRYEVIDGILYGYDISRAERDARPADGCRHELLDGTLIVSPLRRGGTSVACWLLVLRCKRPARPT